MEVRARAIQSDDVIQEATTACPSSANKGEITLSALKPGNYRVEVEALDASGKGTYLGVITRIGVKEGTEVETPEIRLDEKPVNLVVQWTPPGGNCAGNAVRTVEVQVYYNATTSAELVDEMPADCGAEFTNADGDLDAGVMFPDISPNNDVVVVVYGLNVDEARIAHGELGPFVLSPGDDVPKQVTLTACPGTPPICP